MAFVGEAFLSASLEVLLERIISHEFQYFSRNKELLDVSLLKKLKITLLSLQAVMNDAEEKQISNPAVKQWLDELRDALYDADDLLDEINFESLRCKLEAESQIQQPFSDQVLNFLSSPFKRIFKVINSEILDIFQRLEQFALQKDILGLKQGVCGKIWHGIPTSSVVDESAIYGRDDDKMILKDYLMSENDCSKIGVISIVEDLVHQSKGEKTMEEVGEEYFDELVSRHSLLQSLSIYACPNLESFPLHGLNTPNLNNFMVSTCPKLKSLPEPIHSLSSLYQLSVYGLPKLQALAQESLPINLSILEVSSCGSLSTSSITKWGLQSLTCLTELRIRGDRLMNSLMKAEESLLPTSLVSIHISHLFYLKDLKGKWLQHLTSLENLEITDCRRLESLPEDGLPSTLSVLTIKRCLLLQASCQSNGGKEWPKIAHIPCIINDNKVII
ncbi:hypothetical protein P8452_19176 [Trifolium repens]|nr:hypothetical protein P8452_19176 [Trifolium repens]